MREDARGPIARRVLFGRSAGEYATAVLLSTAAAVGMLRLWKADPHVPFDYRGDSVSYGMIVKSIVETGGFLTVPRLSAPGELQMSDFPFALDWTHIVAIKVLSLFSADWAVVFNAYFLIGFPLITVSALAVFRHFKVALGPALAGSILYAFLPSRLLKGEGHLFLDSFYQVPLGILLILWVCDETVPLVREGEFGRWPSLDMRSHRSMAAVVICLLVSSTGSYYAFFTICLLLVGALWASAERRTASNALSGILLSGIIALGFIACMTPVLLYRMRHGSNPEVAARSPREAEMYGMEIARLLQPAPEHRVGILARFTASYNALSPVAGEASALGLVGSVGFLILLGWAVVRRNTRGLEESLMRRLAVLNLTAVLLATVGGFGALVAWLVSPQIRTYARINVVIGFLSLFAVVVVIDSVGRTRAWFARAAPPLVLAIGLFDQVTTGAVRPYGSVKGMFRADKQLVGRIEAKAPRGAMIFELPYLSYPEGGNVHGMTDYDPLRPYLHSRELRWSFPAMRGRFEDIWTRTISAEAPAQLVTDLSNADFEGILIDRPGYADNGSELEGALASVLDGAPDASSDGRLAFFSLAAYKQRMRAGLSADEIERRRDDALHPLLLRWGAGFFHPETGAQGPFLWCSRTGELWIKNGSRAGKSASLSTNLFAAQAPARLFVEGDLVSEIIDLSPNGSAWTRTFVVPSGEHVLRFRSDGRPADAPLDPRSLVWRAENTAFAETAPGTRP
jgi:phosphoglycerol transferase